MVTEKELTLDTTIQRNEEILSHQLSDETVLLGIKKGKYYGFEVVGTRIWELTTQPCSLHSVCETLLSEFEVDRQTCETEVMAFARQLVEEELLTIVNETGP